MTLKLEQKLTLVNTGDGTRYVIQLKSKCDVVRPATADGGSAAAPSLPPVPPAPATTTTSTTTTPIVTRLARHDHYADGLGARGCVRLHRDQRRKVSS